MFHSVVKMAAADGDACEREKVSVNVQDMMGLSVKIDARLAGSIEELKALITDKSNVPVDQLMLIHNCRILQNHRTLQSYRVKEGHQILMVHCSVPNGVEPSATASPAAAVNAANGGSSDSPVSPNFSVIGLGFENTALNATVAPAAANNDSGDYHVAICPNCSAARMGFEEMQQRLVQNPNELFNMVTPQMLRFVIMENPRAKEIVDHNPRLTHMLNDDEIVRRGIQLARNPELMQEMLQIDDMELRNADSFPQWFNMLRRKYSIDHGLLLDIEAMVEAFGYRVRPAPPDGSATDSNTSSESAGRILAPSPVPLPNPRTIAAAGLLNPQQAAGCLPNSFFMNQALQLSSQPAPNQELSTQVAAQADDASGLNPLTNQLREVGANPNHSDLYATQLWGLQEMGFTDTEENIRALQATAGNVQAAVARLHGNMER